MAISYKVYTLCHATFKASRKHECLNLTEAHQVALSHRLPGFSVKIVKYNGPTDKYGTAVWNTTRGFKEASQLK